jgi:glycosyltransferase involved in cell wall biosynthesis
MRVACLCTDRGIGFGGTKGASVHLGELASALGNAGADVLVLVAASVPGTESPTGLHVEKLPPPAAAEPKAWLARRLERFGADVLYERLALHSAAGSRAARAAGIPHVLELNSPLPAEAATYRRLEEPEAADRLERETLANADLVLPVSRPLAAYARRRGARRVEVLPNAVDPARFAAEPTHGPQPAAVFAGTLRPWHGIETIARAWRLLGAAAPPLVVAGDGPGRELLEPVAAEITGSIPHSAVPAVLASAEIGLAPYAAHTPDYFSPLKLFEYLAAGLATVAGDLPGIVDVVDGRSAVVITKGDVPALARSIARLAADPDERSRLGHSGRALVAARHTWQHRAQSVLDLVANLTEGAATCA